MAALKISTSLRNALANQITTKLDTGSTNSQARLLIRTGSPPANPETAASGTLLATVLLHTPPSFGSASTGVITADTIGNVTVAASGTAGWFRIVDKDNNAMIDGDITATGGGGDITFDNITFVSGGTVAISSLTITVPQ